MEGKKGEKEGASGMTYLPSIRQRHNVVNVDITSSSPRSAIVG
jgi:hypothetical protein